MWAAAAPSPVMLPPQQQGMFAWDGGVESPGSPMQVRGAGVSGIGMMSAGSQIAEMQHGGEDLWHRRGGSAKAPVHLQIADIPMAPALSAIPMAPRNRPGDLHATLPTGQGGGGVDALQQTAAAHQGYLVQDNSSPYRWQPWHCHQQPQQAVMQMHPAYQDFMLSCFYDSSGIAAPAAGQQAHRKKRSLNPEDVGPEQEVKRRHSP